MTSRMLKQSDNFKLSHKCSPSQRKVLLKSANKALIHAMSIASPILFKRIQITAKQNGVLPMKKNVLRTLENSRKKTKKKKLLIQHGGGTLKTILGTLLNALASLLVSLLEKRF